MSIEQFPMTPEPWVVRAVNLAEHARNPIHTDEGARAAGFERALVAGVTTYAYLTHPVAAAWGAAWVEHGGGEVRFRSPVCVDDELHCVPRPDDGGQDDAVIVDAVVAGAVVPGGSPRATFRAVIDSGPVPEWRNGESMPDHEVRLGDEFGAAYGSRAGDDLSLYAELGIVHPAVWPALANRVVHVELARGSWVHTRSIVRHHGLVAAGSIALIRSCVVRRWDTNSGERAMLDVRIEVDDAVVATLEHEAIVAVSRG